MEYKNLTGWNLGFSEQGEKVDSYYNDEGNLTERSEQSLLKVPSGLHCGPAGRRTLIKWLEDNYKLSRGINNANPGVMACRLWQESQGLPDEVSKAIVGLLKLQGIPTNVTYKILFENYLSKHLSTLMKRHSHSQKKLCLLADKMISMFQVFQIQPLIVDLLDLLVDIPQSAMSKILEDTSSSHNFYKICTPNIKRKIWAASPEKLFETVIPLIYKCLFLLRLGIFDEEMTSASNTENLNEYNMLITHILQLIGDPQNECSRIVYCQVVTILKLLFMKSTFQYKTKFIRSVGVNTEKDLKNNKNNNNGKGVKNGKNNNNNNKNNSNNNNKTKEEKKDNNNKENNNNKNGKNGVNNKFKNTLNISKFVDCNLCFRNESFIEMKNKDLDFQYNKISCEDLCNLYLTYTNKTMGLSYSCTSSTSSEMVENEGTASHQSSQYSSDGKDNKFKLENQILNLDIDEDLVYQDRGEHFFSAIRYSLAIKCQEMYKITNADMKLIEPNFNLLQLINKVQNSVDNNLPTNELMNIMNKKNIHNNISIKDDMDLFNISFILCNPILYNRIISYYVNYLFNMDITLLTSKVDINYWLSLISLGLSCSYISIVKFILDFECQGEDMVGREDGKMKCVSYLKPYINVCKPVSLKKLLSYIHPVDKDNKLSNSVLPPFFANFISPTMSNEGVDSNSFRKLSEFDIVGEGVHNIPEDDPDTTFHSLLILYLPKLDTKLLNQFRSSCRNFLNLFHKETVEAQDEPQLESSRTEASSVTYSEVDFSKESTKVLVSKILEPFDHTKFDSNSYIGMLLSILERHYYKVKKTKTSTIGQLNFTLLYIVMKKLSFLSHTTMNILSSTSNITKLLFKLITLELVKTGLNLKFDGTRQDSESLLRFISYNRFNKETVVNFKSPTDYSYLRLLRIMMFSDSVKSTKDAVFKFVENVSNYSVATSFILLYYYKKYGKDKNAKQTLERLSRNCHRILYDKENKNNPSYKYRKWTLLFEEMTESLG